MLSDNKNTTPKITSFFAKQVLSAFEFLITDYGFRCVSIEMNFVRYESESVFIIISMDFRNEIDFDIGKLGCESDSGQETILTLGDFLHFVGLDKPEDYNLGAKNRESMEEIVALRAEQVRKYAPDALRGEATIYAKLREQKLNYPREWARSTHQNKVTSYRRKAEIAWTAKKYTDIIELYQSILEDLTPEEMNRLEYAKQQHDDTAR